jgi:predicted PurR-regulated permease PerM
MRLKNLESRVFAALVLVTTLFFFWMLGRFLVPIFWAVVLAILFQPLFLRLDSLLGGRRSLSAMISTVGVLVVVIIPLSLLVAAVAQQALVLYQRVIAGDVALDAPIQFVERQLPAVIELLGRFGIELAQLRASVEAAAIAASQYVAAQALALGQNALTATIIFALILYLLFFFFRDGDLILSGIIRAVPMGDDREQRLLQKFAEVARATVKGTLIVAAVQGALGGLLFALVGIQGAVFWAVVMGILSLLPAVGAVLVWAPAAAILIATGAVWSGIIVILGGTLVIGVVDNLLRPILVGRETQLPDYLILLATLGGISTFGLAGFVAGPVIAALFLVMWGMFADEYAPLDSSERGAVATAPSGAERLPPASSGATGAAARLDEPPPLREKSPPASDEPPPHPAADDTLSD